MELRRLRCFVAVFEERDITVAAQRCFVSQPSLSSSIKQLEQELGAALFVRHKRGVDLTDDAHQLYPLACRLLAQADQLPQLFAERLARVKIRLAHFHDLSPSLLGQYIQRCLASDAQIELELCDHDDLAVDGRLTLDVLKRDDELFVPLWEEDYLLCVPRGHALAQQSSVSLAQLDHYPFIECAACEAHQQTLSLLAAGGFAVDLVAKAAHKTQVRHLVEAGVGISFLPSGVLERSDALVAVSLDAPRMFRRIGLCLSASSAESEPANTLLHAASSDAGKK
ncbi:LysR family transcriptional regulator [Ferrimonas pelagia]|uniref:LysR family transcriptional regulator n=1 Tax=Ferrimonas pelagia TaxID=1177826 RepID=A0ABP9EU75_9GAMM